MRLSALLVGVLAACTAPEERKEFVCDDAAKVVSLRDTHFPDESCDSAKELAETRLTMALYLKACQQLAPSAGLPSRVRGARVTRCEAAKESERGVVAQIEVCCL